MQRIPSDQFFQNCIYILTGLMVLALLVLGVIYNPLLVIIFTFVGWLALMPFARAAVGTFQTPKNIIAMPKPDAHSQAHGHRPA